MRRTHALTAVVVLAAAVGCNRNPPGREEANPVVAMFGGEKKAAAREVEAHAGFRSVPATKATLRSSANDLAPPWPQLPALPPRAAKTTTQTGARFAQALDDAADDLVTRDVRPGATADSWLEFSFRRAFDHLEKPIAAYPRREVEKEVFAPTGDGEKDRDVIDARFARFWTAWQTNRERNRRWQVEWSENVIRQVTRMTPREVRAEAERTSPPGKPVKLTSDNFSSLETEKYDWLEIDVARRGPAKWRSNHAAWGTGRVSFGEDGEITGWSMCLALSGTVGGTLTLNASGPGVIDLTELRAPHVKVTGKDVLIRVGPGVGRLELGPQRALVLARGAPNLKVAFIPRHQTVAVVSY